MPEYVIGDRVVATRDIWEEANEDMPASVCAARGDVLVVRRINLHDQEYPISVSHENRLDNSFGVASDEIRRA